MHQSVVTYRRALEGYGMERLSRTVGEHLELLGPYGRVGAEVELGRGTESVSQESSEIAVARLGSTFNNVRRN